MMKKIVMLMAAISLLSGCGAAKPVSLHDPLEPGFAYVTGQYLNEYTNSYWSREGGSKFDDLDNVSIEFGAYEVYKVRPGKYTIESVNTGFTNRTITSYGQGLAYFVAEPGKLTYIGDVLISGAGIGGMGGSAMLTVRDNSSKAKEHVLKNYPGLGKNIDSIFVFRPARAFGDNSDDRIPAMRREPVAKPISR